SDALTPRERQVVSLRFGLHSGSAASLEQVASQLSVSRERIRQIEHQAILKLRRLEISARLRPYCTA
ncbi:MAG TPA: sigma factor-like helix-turn-helix DNA-binding protein, partial [Chloroflexota bacterium]|nr:sigma factor-like helix-turn-helix DNA-binding protein [Chloroflexota bacterium]